mgnify:CR=1 FL=1
MKSLYKTTQINIEDLLGKARYVCYLHHRRLCSSKYCEKERRFDKANNR